MTDLRLAFRNLRQTPVLATVIILSLAVGIGANTIVFSWTQSLLLQPLPGVARSGSLQTIEARTAYGAYPGLSWSDYLDLRSAVTAIDGLLAYRATPLYAGEPGRDERISAMLVSGNYFSTLGLHPAQGRFFRADEAAQPGGPPVAVISHDYWKTRFASSPDVVGQTIRLNGIATTIVGVAPDPFQGTAVALSYDLWVPATLAPVLLGGSRELESRDLRGYHTLGHLRSDATPALARDETAATFHRLAEAYPATNAGFTGEVSSFWRSKRGAQTMFGPALATLQVIMLLVLLLVCANTANLLLARATARHQEMGIRRALGASSWRIVRQLLAEGTVLAAAAVALGALLSLWGIDAFASLPMPRGIPVKLVPHLDLVGLAFALALAGGCTLLFGLAPALQLARTDIRSALHGGTVGSGGTPTRARFRHWLVATETALALVVLVIAVFFMKNLLDERGGDAGFRTRDVTLAAYDLGGLGYDIPAARRFTADLLTRLHALPGVDRAAISSLAPLDLHGLPVRGFTVSGRPRTSTKPDTALSYNLTPGYFAALDVPFVAGTDFADFGDTTHGPQAIVNEEFVRRYLAGLPAVGNTLTVDGASFAIVGVVRNMRYESLAEPPQPALFFSYRDRVGFGGQIYLRTRSTDLTVGAELRTVLHQIDPRIRVYDVRTFEQHVDRNLFLRRVPARLFAILGPFALLLAAIGTYAVVAHGVAQRTAEIGLRLALGAAPRQIVALLVRASLGPVLAGLAAGSALIAIVLLHLPSGKGPGLPLQLGVSALLFVVAAIACWLPARRAARLNPLEALRIE